jgi:hypothetical protein
MSYKNIRPTLLTVATQTVYLPCLRKFNVLNTRCPAHANTIINFLANTLYHLALSCCSSPSNAILLVVNVLRQWWYVHSVLHVAPEDKIAGRQRRPSDGAASTRASASRGIFFILPSKCSLDTDDKLCGMKLQDTQNKFLPTCHLFYTVKLKPSN